MVIQGLSKNTFIYDRMRDGTFPKQIQLGSRTVVWNEQEVTKWMKTRWRPDDPDGWDLNTNRTLLRQGTHGCSAFFCACLKSSVI